MARNVWVVGLTLLAVACAAKDTYRTATKAEIQSFVADHTISFSFGMVLVYGPGSAYEVRYNGQTDKGNYAVNDNGTICVKFIPKGERCDTILTDGTSFDLVTAKGERNKMMPR